MDYRSAEIVTDLDKIHHLMESRSKHLQGKSFYSCKQDDDGRTILSKVHGLADLKAAKVPEAEIRRLTEERNIPWDDEYVSRVIPYWGSDERSDSHGDIVRQSWIFDLYSRNPALAFSHEWSNLPIGNSIDWEVRNRVDKDYSGPALYLLALFATKEVSERADSVFRLIKAGILRAGSVGFFADKVIDIKDEEERAELGLGRWGFILEDNHLLEYSPTMLGANSGAQVISLSQAQKAKRAFNLNDHDFLVLRELYRQTFAETNKDGWKESDTQFRHCAKLLFPKSRWDAAKDINESFLEPEEVTRGPKIKQDVESLEAAIADLTLMVQDGMLGLSQMLEDVRNLLEDMASPNDDDDDEDGDTEGDVSEETNSRLNTILNRVNGLFEI